ncbi:hypothetical protein QH494_20205 [Sphingomonas sp. AR_OL41]|jgi:hypothetical protein|uniref:hypothetical protein n=1 Tax=Parasphingomonas halimpatiens TaxID=3096162 RepID=UPI0024812618|nr:hypothetical protein [Sphingomonas sp. AR_OL41]MDH7974519.1 hypothetical protein [Sphingomonas sp. AR_OL41]
MKFSRVTAALIVASLSAPAFAGADQAIGKLTSADQGTFVARDGKLVPAFAGQQLFVGDRIVTRGKASARVQSQGCSYTVAPTSMLSVAGCGSSAKSFAAGGDDDSSGAGEGGSGGSGYVIGGLALLAVAGGVIAATSNSSSKPASP